jgi:hypothetical protein
VFTPSNPVQVRTSSSFAQLSAQSEALNDAAGTFTVLGVTNEIDRAVGGRPCFAKAAFTSAKSAAPFSVSVFFSFVWVIDFLLFGNGNFAGGTDNLQGNRVDYLIRAVVKSDIDISRLFGD